MKSPGVRKGAWSGEEDVLLRRCIELHGEGKWHLVPQRAGLNRCRKSCRLRWLNYLRPNLSREKFKEDEIDLIFKMHKLLGNRWSLIAGRIPGRTAYDIKNYWNSNLSKQLCSKQDESPRQSLKRKRHEVLRPQPRSFNVKGPSQGPVESDIVKTKQQQQQEEKQNLWLSKLVLEDDMDSGQNQYNINEGLFKDSISVGMEPEAVRFDCSAVEWEDLVVINDWLIK